MASLIEAAAKRLEQLRQAGILDRQEPAGVKPSTIEQARRMLNEGGLANAPRPAAAVSIDATDADKVDLQIDTQALEARGFITPDGPRTLIHEQYRVIKRQLLRNATGKGQAAMPLANLIMVTSALAGEGKTFSAINLAMSIATELDHKVLLVDADVARPSVLNTLAPDVHGFASDSAPRGLLDLVEGRCQLSDVVLRTNVDKLSVLPGGTYRAHATEMLASDGMRAMLEQVAMQYRDLIVIFDSPPLLLTTEAQVLASLVGQVVVVVQAGYTTHRAVKSALATIEHCPQKLLLLNRVSLMSEEAQGGYGYGYGGGYGQGYGPRSRSINEAAR